MLWVRLPLPSASIYDFVILQTQDPQGNLHAIRLRLSRAPPGPLPLSWAKRIDVNLT